MDDPSQIAEGGAEIAAGLLAGAADLGDDMLAGRRPRRVPLLASWLVAVLDAALLWSRFSRLFDASPGTAVLIGGAFIMLVVGLIAITVSPMRRRLGDVA